MMYNYPVICGFYKFYNTEEKRKIIIEVTPELYTLWRDEHYSLIFTKDTIAKIGYFIEPIEPIKL